MIYSCLIADDNIIERDLIEMFLRKINSLEIKKVCQNGSEVATYLIDNNIDIVFCDIDMPDLSGIGLLKSLRKPPVFIFITSYADYAVESINLDVLDFILKPATFERILKSANKAIEYLQLKGNLNAESIPKESPRIATDDHFFIKETQGITKLKYNDVVFIESMGDFSKIHTLHTNTHIVLSGLKNLELQIPENIFKRVHKQYIVNLNYVATISSADVLLHDKRTIPLGQQYRQQLLEAFVNKEVIKRNFTN